MADGDLDLCVRLRNESRAEVAQFCDRSAPHSPTPRLRPRGRQKYREMPVVSPAFKAAVVKYNNPARYDRNSDPIDAAIAKAKKRLAAQKSS